MTSIQNLKITEKYGLTGNINVYTSQKDKFLKFESSKTESNKYFIYNFCRKVFLPQGYPKTVSEDYFEYQFYDTIQAFASRISGTIATKSILKSLGVGNSQATPLSAAITWIFKDGVGMFGGILFAWCKGTEFDSNCKRWRLFADILNDCAMFLEISLPYFNNTSNLGILCLTTCMKAVVGVAGNATRAAVTQHQAVDGNAADVAAKDGSQETAVNLIASLFGIFLLTLLEDSRFELSLFIFFTVLHLLANYFAVKSLIFKHLNIERLIIICKSYFRFNSIPSSQAVNRLESVFLYSRNTDSDFCGFKIKLGSSFQDITSCPNLKEIINIQRNKPYILIPDLKSKQIHVLLKPGENSNIIITAYFHALIFGLSYHISNDLNLVYLKKKIIQTPSLLNKLKDNLGKLLSLEEILIFINNFVNQEISPFLSALQKEGWKIDVHSITLEDWRLNFVENID